MLDTFSPLDQKPETLTEVVYGRIHEAIVTRALPSSARITEAAIAKQLNVSKTPVREALLRLREVGLIEPDGVRGNRVISPSSSAIRDAYEIREVLEAFTARVVAERRPTDAVRTIRAAAERSLERARAGDVAGFRDADRTFHQTIAEAGGNPRMRRTIDDAVALITALRERDLPSAQAVVRCAESHVNIALAIEAGDEDAAAEQMREHIAEVEGYMLSQPLGEDDAHAE